MTDRLERNWLKIFIVMTVLCALLSLLIVNGQNIWSDEAYSMRYAQLDWMEIWDITALDVHPPLYYWMLKAFMAVAGSGIYQAKLFSVIAHILTLAFCGWQLRKLFGSRLSLCFMALYILFPFSFGYVEEIRMYSWSAFFTSVCAIYAYKAFQKSSVLNWAMLALSTLAASYTHYFALVSVGIINFALMVGIIRHHRSMKWVLPFIISLVLIFACYLPWLGEFIAQLVYKAENEYWIEPVTLRVIASWVASYLSAGNAMSALIVAFISLLLLLNLVFRVKEKPLTLALLALAVPVGTAFVGLAASIIVRPVFVIRYLVPATPCFVFFLALAITNLDDKALRWSALSVLIAFYITNWFKVFDEEYEERTNLNLVDQDFVDRYEDCDCYLFITPGTTNDRGVLSYFDQEKTIYDSDETGEASPFANVKLFSDWSQLEGYDSIILITEDNLIPPDETFAKFDVKYLETTDQGYIWRMDIYMLKPKC